MVEMPALERFAPTILQVYHRDKHAFWSAVMAPFLANQVSFLAQWEKPWYPPDVGGVK